MKIVTWNMNSVRLRAPLVVKLMREETPDIICLQETKTPNDSFPTAIFEDEGYTHIHIDGMKSYNGVCVLSRAPFTAPAIYERVGRRDCRHIAVSFPDFDLHNLYIPAGGDEPDRQINDKFGHKLDFVDEMTDWFARHYRAEDHVVTLGDFNIAPMEHDVWSHKQLLKVVSHTPVEVEKLTRLYQSLNWQDAIRHFISEDQKCYTWWSYRNRDWRKSNRGRRLDHIWVTSPMVGRLKDYKILEHYRDLEKPSDHVPVMVVLKRQ